MVKLTNFYSYFHTDFFLVLLQSFSPVRLFDNVYYTENSSYSNAW